MELEFQEEKVVGSQKEFYFFQEVVTAADVKPYVLRFWETEFDDIKPTILENGKKSYSHKDIKIIHLIKKLLFDEKMSIPEAKVAIKQRLSEIENIEIPDMTLNPLMPENNDEPIQVSVPTEPLSSTVTVEESEIPQEMVNEITVAQESSDKNDETSAVVKEAQSEILENDLLNQTEIQESLMSKNINQAHFKLEAVLKKIEDKLEGLK